MPFASAIDSSGGILPARHLSGQAFSVRGIRQFMPWATIIPSALRSCAAKWAARYSSESRQTKYSELDIPIASLRDALNELSVNSMLCSIEPFRREAALRLTCMARELQDLARGTIGFTATESWRTVYESVLESCRTRRYLSTALVRTENYWRHPPGEQSLELNYRLIGAGFYIQRLFIIDEFLWPPGAELPSRELAAWISEQHNRGIEVSVVRENHLDSERELISDFGIYGDSAVGYLTTDEQGDTIKYELRFDRASIQAAEANWNKLMLYATSWENLVDQSGD